MNWLHPEEVDFVKISAFDDAGRVFFHQGRVFRAIYSSEHAELYLALFKKGWIEEVFDRGLVNSWISKDVQLQGSVMTLEHEAVAFETHPAEHTSYMHWLAAKAIVGVNLALSRYGFLLKDAHPWNVMFSKGSATVVDFGSIVKSETVPFCCLEEFRRYFCVPIWLASTRWYDYAGEYRRQHGNGFGLKLFDNKLINVLALSTVTGFKKHLSTPVDFFKHLDGWLDKHKPVTGIKGKWADYQQCGEILDTIVPQLPKQKFVFEVLSREKPEKVLDLAANKGYYSEMAATLGAAVVASDYEEYCVDQCLLRAQQKRLSITPALLNFSRPTPSYGVGLYGRDSYRRFRSDIALALGLVHHVCIAQNLPVEVFCNICLEYATRGVILEYVDRSDKHVASWGLPIPADYSMEAFANFFSRKFPTMLKSETLTDDGLCRVMIYFCGSVA